MSTDTISDDNWSRLSAAAEAFANGSPSESKEGDQASTPAIINLNNTGQNLLVYVQQTVPPFHQFSGNTTIKDASGPVSQQGNSTIGSLQPNLYEDTTDFFWMVMTFTVFGKPVAIYSMVFTDKAGNWLGSCFLNVSGTASAGSGHGQWTPKAD